METVFEGRLSTLRAARAAQDALRAPESALPVAAADDRSVWNIDNGLVDRITAEDVLLRALEDKRKPWPVPLASDAARIYRDGDRVSWETAAFTRQHRLSRATVAAAITLDHSWIDEVADGIWLLCEQSSWCWPAHDDTFERHGNVLATISDPFLDLGAGEAVAQLAWIDHLLAAQLDNRYPGIRSRIRLEADKRVFTPFLSRHDWHWLGLDGDVHNWNPWIHGNVLVAALALLDQSDPRREVIVAACIDGLDRYVAVLPEDGAIDEGYAYWWNGACRALEALEVLAHATAGQFDPTGTIPALRETINFPMRCHLGGDWYLNLADGQAKPPPQQPWHALHRAAIRVGNTAAQAHAAAQREAGQAAAHESEGLGRLLLGMTDPAWSAAGQAEPALPTSVWLPSTQVMLARSHTDPSGLTLAAKGGHNGEHHNHNDVGSVVVASNGVPVLVDAGRPTYTKQTFGPGRYDIWTMQSSWHNLPEIRGTAQSAGSVFGARSVRTSDDGALARLSLDVSAAYQVPGLRSWLRTATLDRRDGIVTIVDDWDLEEWAGAGPEPATKVHFLLAGDVVVNSGEAVVVPIGNAPAVRIRWDEAVPCYLQQRELDDPLLTEVWGDHLTRIALDVTTRRSLTVTVEGINMIGMER